MNGKSFIYVIVLGLFIAGGLFFWEITKTETQPLGKVVISEAVANSVSKDGNTVLVSLKVKNESVPQKIVRISSVDADHGMIHGLEPKSTAVIPANSKVSLGLDGVHLMLMKVKGDLKDGRLITLKVKLDPAGELVTKARFSSKVLNDHGIHRKANEQGKGHKISTFNVPDSEPKPSLSIGAKADGENWKINIATENFRFAKDLADGEHVAGTGHGHIYINGIKLGRVFGETFSIGALPMGDHIVRVTLNTNDHKAYEVDGKEVTATTTIFAK